ncbi:MAG: Ig-like domain-containing protein, partial [Deltaproteobacteria bacterium]|nr:Ig-like domain-containing protein [Deltaproteobacteria bacterium]
TFTATLTPDGALDPLTAYTVTVTENVTNTIGDTLDREYTWLFVTRAGEILLYVEPDEDETDVSVAAHICGIFTEDVDDTTVDKDSFFATFEDQWGRTEQITGSYTFVTLPSGAGKVCLVPEPDEYDCLWDRGLLYDTLYTATITTVVELDNDAEPPDTLTTDFTWSFETTSEPEIVSRVPEDGEKDVPIVIEPLTATFDRPVDETTVTTDTLILATVETVPVEVDGTVSVADDGITVQFWPTFDLDFRDDMKAYTFTVLSGVDGVLDVEGNYLLEDHSVTFQTSPMNAYTMVPNQLESPAGAEESDLIELHFERPLDVATVVADNILLEKDDVVLNANYAYDPDTRTVSIIPIPEVASGLHTVTVLTGLHDHLGNPFPQETTIPFDVTGNANNSPQISLGPTTTTIQGHDLLWVEGSDNLMVSSVTNHTVILTEIGPATQIPMVVDEYGLADDRIYLRPTVYLRSGNGVANDYTFEVTSGVTDLSRNAGAGDFENLVVEIDPPEVVVDVESPSPFPADEATDVPGAVTVKLEFDERMDEASIDLSTVRLLDGSLAPVAGAATLDKTGTSWTFQPKNYLDMGVTYTIDVTEGATDTAANFAVPFSSTFTVDDDEPYVDSAFPDDEATGISAGFSESILGTPGNVRVLEGTDDVYLCIDVNGDVVTLDLVDRGTYPEPDLPLDYSTVYDVYVAGVTDVADNPQDPSPFESSFTTEAP